MGGWQDVACVSYSVQPQLTSGYSAVLSKLFLGGRMQSLVTSFLEIGGVLFRRSVSLIPLNSSILVAWPTSFRFRPKGGISQVRLWKTSSPSPKTSPSPTWTLRTRPKEKAPCQREGSSLSVCRNSPDSVRSCRANRFDMGSFMFILPLVCNLLVNGVGHGAPTSELWLY